VAFAPYHPWMAVPSSPARLRVLVAAPSPSDVGAIASAIGSAGHEVVTAYRAETTLARVADERPDLLLIDPTMPDGDGVAIIARVHARTDAPIIVIADIRNETAVVAALDAGAIDVVGRPVRVGELVARIHAAARRGVPSTGAYEPSLDGLRIDVGRREATVEGRNLALTPTEFELLSVLAARRGDVVDHRALLRAAWPGRPDVDPETLRSHLTRVNAKLVAEGHPGLRNVRGRGYAVRIAGSRPTEG
jgi:two-component system, OmpR family, KDP operon response regulator KdpE